MTKKVAIIIPALNEEESIADVIDNVLEVGYQNPEYNLFLEIIDCQRERCKRNSSKRKRKRSWNKTDY